MRMRLIEMVFSVYRIIGVFVLLPLCLEAQDEVTPAQFAGDDGVLSPEEVIEFLLVSRDVSYGDILKRTPMESEINAAKGDVFQAKKFNFYRRELWELEGMKGLPPYSPEDIEDYVHIGPPAEKGGAVNDTVGDTGGGLNFDWNGIWGEALEKGKMSYGPFLVRQKVEDWGESIRDVTGATLSYSRNEFTDSNSWVTQGSLIYPVVVDSQGGDRFDYEEISMLPSLSWNKIDVSSASEDEDVEELNFQIPFALALLHKGKYEGNPDWADSVSRKTLRSEFYFSPYYFTDFGFRGGVVGAALSYEPIFQSGSSFQTGSWQSLLQKTYGPWYLLRVIPRLEYDQVVRESEYILRDKRDERFAIGSSIELGIQPWGEDIPWEFRASYTFRYNFMDDDKSYRDYWDFKAIWWFDQNVGLNAQYQKGDTPIAEKNIDLYTIGFEVRF